jgi:DNA-binding LacI/PurR family transcriptional regulator
LRERVLRVYDGFLGANATAKPVNSPVCRHLETDLRQHAFSGFVEIQLNPDTEAARAERAALPAARWGSLEEADAALDGRHFMRESVRWLAAQGRRKICYVSFIAERRGTPYTEMKDEAFVAALAEFCLPQFRSRPIVLADTPSTSERVIYENALRTVREWFAPGSEAQRPDALIVDDDIGMRAVALALIRLGVDVPGQLTVVTEANQDFELHYGIPVVRYEISAREIARELWTLLWKRIATEPLPELPILIRGRIREDGK